MTQRYAHWLTCTVALLLIGGCETKPKPAETEKPQPQPEPKASSESSPAKEEKPMPKAETKADETAATSNHVTITTNRGKIAIELDPEKAPITVKNFLQYVDEGFYDGTVFHRVIDKFMIQGGGFTPDLKEKASRDGIENEWQNGLKNTRGTIAMARKGGNPNSATSQFFINVANHGALDQPQRDGAGYAVFGKVVAGMDVVDAIKQVETKNAMGHLLLPSGEYLQSNMGDVPVETVRIESIKRVE